MSAELNSAPRSIGRLPEGEASRQNVADRQRSGKIWQYVLLASTLAGLLVLALLLYNIVNDGFGAVAVQSNVSLKQLTGDRELAELSKEELLAILDENLRSRVLRNLEREQPLSERDEAQLAQIVEEEIIKPEIVAIFTLSEWLTDRAAIEAIVAEKYPRAELEFRSWISGDFVVTPMASNPAVAGVRTAILGTLWLLVLTMLIAFPLGIGAALYLEEYAQTKLFDERTAMGRLLNSVIARISGIIQINIYNLSGVPSIIYGMLGLAIFVRALEFITSGQFLGGGNTTANGRTILAAAFTMALLVLPIVIIASQEAIRAVPSSLRQASFGLGATRWQTVWRIVLPSAMPGILTSTILAISRAIGETAPLIVVGASTFIVTDPDGPFSKFTVLPIQIYNWTSRPQEEFRAIAAAGIIVLLLMLLTTNAAAILLRNYLRSKRVSQ